MDASTIRIETEFILTDDVCLSTLKGTIYRGKLSAGSKIRVTSRSTSGGAVSRVGLRVVSSPNKEIVNLSFDCGVETLKTLLDHSLPAPDDPNTISITDLETRGGSRRDWGHNTRWC